MSDPVELKPIASSPKPGWKTSEFWLRLASHAMSVAFASGLIPTSGPVAMIAGIAAVELGSLGYTVARTIAKAGS